MGEIIEGKWEKRERKNTQGLTMFYYQWTTSVLSAFKRGRFYHNHCDWE